MGYTGLREKLRSSKGTRAFEGANLHTQPDWHPMVKSICRARHGAAQLRLSEGGLILTLADLGQWIANNEQDGSLCGSSCISAPSQWHNDKSFTIIGLARTSGHRRVERRYFDSLSLVDH